MARTVNQWRKEVESVLHAEGVRNFSWEFTGGTHQRVSGTVTVSGGRDLPVSLLVSVSPSDRKAAYRVKSDARALLRAARSM